MDIAILHALQQLRESSPSIIETILSMISFIGDGPGLVAIVLIVYWGIDKRAGTFAMASFGTSNFVCQFIKNIACVYRPWVRDPTITPAASALEGAGGYSFPSGHTAGATSSLGSLAWAWRKKHRWVMVVAVIIVLLMMFSRLFLGVHTPQDVLVGLLVALIVIALMHAFFSWIERCDAMTPGHNKDIIVMVVALAICVISVIVVQVKPYPMDYVDGALLVDPVTMQKGSLEAAGIVAGFVISWVLERRIVGFSTEGIDTRSRVIRVIIGVVLVGIAFLGGNALFKLFMPVNYAKMITYFTVVIFGVFLAPLAFNKFENRGK